LAAAGRQFTQAADMPFLQPPLLQLFTESNIYTPVFNQVLNKTFVCPSRMDPMAQRLIQALQQQSQTWSIPPCALDEITAGCQRAKEATSFSPSGLHFSHYMAGTFNPMIVVFNARLANLGFTTG